MKANIVDIKRFAVHDGPGIRTTLFFKGCPLHCLWCHNPESISPTPQLAYYSTKCVGCMSCVSVCPSCAHQDCKGEHLYDRTLCTACGACVAACPEQALTLFGWNATLDELLPLLLEDRAFYDTSGGGVTLSGGECLMQAEFCAELLARLKKHGIHTAVDTCGFVPRQSLDRVIPYTDLFLYDLKAAEEDVHIRCTGQSNRLILDNLNYLDRQGCKTEIRIPYVPGHNDDQMAGIHSIISGLKHVTQVRVLPYHNYAGSKYSALGMPNTLPARLPNEEELRQANQYFLP